MINLDHPEVAKYFQNDGRGNWRCKQTGKVISGAILDFYRSFGDSGLNGLTYLGLPLTDAVLPVNIPYEQMNRRNISIRSFSVQKFERAIIADDYWHLLDFPPGSGGVYLMNSTTELTQTRVADLAD